MIAMIARICPFCSQALEETWVCPTCGRTINPGDWPQIPGYPEVAPYFAFESEEGLCACKAEGVLCTGLPYELRAGKSCVRIGGSPRVADILIENAADLHAVLLRNRSTCGWWVFDCTGGIGILVNGQTTRLHELQDGDVISVLGVRFAFRGNRLETADSGGGGLAISVVNLSFTPQGMTRPILDDVSFSVRPGEFVGVLGPSGCGKSTLIRCLTGLADADAASFKGEVLVNGNPRADVEDEFRALTAYLPQNVNESLNGKLTLSREVECFRRLHLGSDPDEKREVDECLSSLGLRGKENSLIGNMSGGEQRRVGIALALMRKPRLLLLDEPGAGLDPSTEFALMCYLRGIANQGRTVLCVTHILVNADLFDKVLVFSRGKVVYFGPPGNLLEECGARNLTELYEALADGNVRSVRSEKSPHDRTVRAMPKSVEQANSLQVAGAYLKRFWYNFVSGVSGKLGWLRSEPALLFLLQPLVLVVGLRIACACYFRSTGDGVAIGNMQMLGFCAALSMFWVGINNASRAFVHGRIPGRCLERLNGVSIGGYVGAQVLWSSLLAMGQSLSFTILLMLGGVFEVELVESVCVNALSLSPLWFFPLFATCLSGACIGLAVSAAAKREITAVAMVPNLAILSLLFSDAVIGFEVGGSYMSVARTLAETFMPCHWPSRLMEALQSGGAIEVLVMNVLLQLLATIVICLVIIGWRQSANERAWKGW